MIDRPDDEVEREPVEANAPEARPEGMLLCDGLEKAFVGVVERFGGVAIACYDRDKVLKQYIKDGMSHDEAEEFFEFNVIGAWVGDRTPCFLTRMSLKMLNELADEGMYE